jgi:hypothetical protein
MRLEGELQFSYKDDTFSFRSISPEEVSPMYLEGLRQDNEFLEHVPSPLDQTSQYAYVSHIIDSEEDTICGLFRDEKLIATAGIQNLRPKSTEITVGIFVFDPLDRGKGYWKVLVWAACRLSIDALDVSAFWGGMNQKNVRSYKSSISCGAVATLDPEKGSYRLTMLASDLIRLPWITKVEYNESDTSKTLDRPK